MKPQLEKIGCKIVENLVVDGFCDNPLNWFMDQPSVGDFSWLLAYADDGVVWGKICNGKLMIANNIFGESFPKMNTKKIHFVRFFGHLAEIRVFQKDSIFSAVRLEDEPNDKLSFIRSYFLWGNSVRDVKDGWTFVEEGQHGIFQAIPIEIPHLNDNKTTRLKIRIRYYLDFEKEHGQAKVVGNRFVGII